METVKFSDITVIYICPAHNEKYLERKAHMDVLCAKLGFKEVIHWKSGTDKYPVCLTQANIDIMRAYPDKPFLLLEDDVDVQGLCEFQVPEDADAVYLGLSKCAGHSLLNIHDGSAKLERYSTDQVRVMNMLATHAIYYRSAEYKRSLANYLETCANTLYHMDVLMTRIQPAFRIYANKKPLFYQANRFNFPHNLEAVTRFELL
jgi:hypothetical protein